MGNRSKNQSPGAFGKKQFILTHGPKCDSPYGDTCNNPEAISIIRPNRGRDRQKHVRVKRKGQRSISVSQLTSSLKAGKHISQGAATTEHKIDAAKKPGLFVKIGKAFQRKGA